MENIELEITIDPSGKTQIHIRGIKGPGCLSLTKQLEEILGRPGEQNLTAEFYEPPDQARIDLRMKNP